MRFIVFLLKEQGIVTINSLPVLVRVLLSSPSRASAGQGTINSSPSLHGLLADADPPDLRLRRSFNSAHSLPSCVFGCCYEPFHQEPFCGLRNFQSPCGDWLQFVLGSSLMRPEQTYLTAWSTAERTVEERQSMVHMASSQGSPDRGLCRYLGSCRNSTLDASARSP